MCTCLRLNLGYPVMHHMLSFSTIIELSFHCMFVLINLCVVSSMFVSFVAILAVFPKDLHNRCLVVTFNIFQVGRQFCVGQNTWFTVDCGYDSVGSRFFRLRRSNRQSHLYCVHSCYSTKQDTYDSLCNIT